MDRIHVMELVRSFQVGQLSRRDFEEQAAAALGSRSAAHMLMAACGPTPREAPPVILKEPEASLTWSFESAARSLLLAEMAEYPDPDGETLTGYLARPVEGGRRPAVVVIQEWWGLDGHIKDVAGRFVNEGFVALAPDLYHGAVASEPDEARKLVMELDMEAAVREIRAAIAFLLAQDYVIGPQVGIVGFCMGGRLVLATARVEGNLGAAVAFYGSPLTPEEATEVKAPLLGLYGDRDHIPVPDVRAMQAALDRAGIENEFHIYEGAEHAFFNDTRASYHAEAAADAWMHTLAWFRAHLPG
jgi:carboxymethylenebutenolidase